MSTITTVLLFILGSWAIGLILEYYILKAYDTWKHQDYKVKTLPPDLYATNKGEEETPVERYRNKCTSTGVKSSNGRLFEFTNDEDDIPW